MKTIFKCKIIIVITLFFVAFVGCGGDDENPTDKPDTVDFSDLDFVNSTWQIVSINGETFEEIFTPAEPDPGEQEFEHEFMLGGNKWVFDEEGMFTGTLEHILKEKYTDPDSSLTFEIAITSEGEYTAGNSTLEIIKQDMKIDVDAKLEPKEVWEQQIQGKTVEALESDFAANTKKEFTPTVSNALLKEGVEYAWVVEGDTLTVSLSNMNIVFERVSE